MKKFSLIELLVVIAIIGILASLLLPVLSKARNKSKQIVCSSQHSQLGKAIFMYQDDHEYLPSASGLGTSSRLGYKNALAPYLGNVKTENAPFLCPSADLTTGWANQETGTAYNELLGHVRAWIDLKVKLTEIENPAQTGATADSVDGTEWWPASKVLPSQDAVGYRHSEGLNISWTDGHVQWFSTVTIQAGRNSIPDYYYMVQK